MLENSGLSTKIISLFQTYNLENKFLEPTRITPTSATCLDNIYTDIIPTQKAIINLIDSDHCGQLITIPNVNKTVTKKDIIINPKSKNRLETFKTKLLSKLPLLSVNDDPNQHYNDFL